MRPGFLFVLVCLVAAVLGASGARAQSCTFDGQCSTIGLGGAGARCIGNALVVQRSQCIGGRCQVVNETTQNCGGGGRCDPALGRCVETSAGRSEICTPGGVCSGKRLIVSSGQRAASGCQRTSRICKNGCACSPEPRCL